MPSACTQPQAHASSDDQSSTYELSTADFAYLNGIKEQSVRARLSRTGSYFGIRPLKCSNRRTLWPCVIVKD